ncbi:MAG: hypothetical protein IIC53_07895 [Proteobacteria bacterium]|nr:hypothetical protein [Pseudomonadota bacterium]
MKWLDRIVLRLAYRLSSKKERERHLRELEHLLIENQILTQTLKDKLNLILQTPLREREKEADYLTPGYASRVKVMRDTIAENQRAGDRLKERIEIIHPSFPKARLHRRK